MLRFRVPDNVELDIFGIVVAGDRLAALGITVGNGTSGKTVHLQVMWD